MRAPLRVVAAWALLSGACVAGGDPAQTQADAGDSAASGGVGEGTDGTPRAGAETAGRAVTPAIGEVVYRFDWDTSGVTLAADGAGFVVTNDLGFTVEVDLGYLVTFSTELVECPTEEHDHDHDAQAADPDAVEQAARLLRLIVGMGVAHAGHSSLDPNPAKLTTRLVERLHDPQAQEVGRLTLEHEHYCQLHYLAGKTAKDRQDPADDVDMIGRSLYLEGWVTSPGAEVGRELLVDGSFANGVVLDLPEEIDTATEGATVTITRSLRALFDGVDFDAMTDSEISNQLMKSLVAGVSVTVDPVP